MTSLIYNIYDLVFIKIIFQSIQSHCQGKCHSFIYVTADLDYYMCIVYHCVSSHYTENSAKDTVKYISIVQRGRNVSIVRNPTVAADSSDTGDKEILQHLVSKHG